MLLKTSKEYDVTPLKKGKFSQRQRSRFCIDLIHILCSIVGKLFPRLSTFPVFLHWVKVPNTIFFVAGGWWKRFGTDIPPIRLRL